MTQRLRQLPETALTPVLGRRLRVSDVLAFPALEGAVVRAGAAGLDRPLVRVNVMQVPTAGFARPDELIIATTSAFDEPQETPAALLAGLAEHGVAALAAHGPTLDKLGEEGLAAAEQHALPLIALPSSARLSTLLTVLLETLVASQAAHLRMAATTRDELADVVLGGGGMPRLAGVLAELVGGSVAIVGEDGAALAISDEADRDAAEGAARLWLAEGAGAPAETRAGWLLWPIAAAGAQLGCVAAHLRQAHEPLALAAVQSGARMAAFAILHELEEAAAVARLTERFVDDLLVGHLDPPSARQRALALGWDPATPFRALLVGDGDPSERPDVALAIRRRVPEALVVKHDGLWLALLPAAAADAPAAAADIAGALADARAGLSAEHGEIPELPAAYGEAREALHCVELFGAGTAVRTFDPQSPLRMLARVPAGELADFARATLAPLDAVEPAQRDALSATLALLIETGLNVADTARRGGWHYNTVRYRVRRLEELLGPFTSDGARLDAVTLALLLRRELTGADPRPLDVSAPS
ncbi:MAG: PucR family transcriptional regulator [Conexibacter sp.]